jgi:tetratricopeptide (TPR) repeat protein
MRYHLLETVRQYAAELLDERAAGEVAAAHARFFLQLAQTGAPFQVEARDVARWLERFDDDHDNLRAALRWYANAGDADAELQLAASLWRFWYVRGHLTEGRRRLEDALARPGGAGPTRAPALKGLAGIAWSQNDLEAADAYAEEALALAREVGDGKTAYTALTVRISAATARLDLDASKALCREAEKTARQAFPQGLGLVDFHLGDIAWLEERLDEAEGLYRRALAHARRIDSRELAAFTLDGLGRTALKRGAPREAQQLLIEALRGFEALAFKRKLAECLDGLAAAVRELGDPRRGAFLLGAADRFDDQIGGRSLGWPRDFHAALDSQLRDELGPDEFEHAYATGQEAALGSVIDTLTADSPASRS